MTGRDSFLRAICASPDDDLLRLVYAGWLEENGDLDRAAFIRARCAMARVPEYDPVRVQYWDLEGRWRPGMTAAEEEPPPLPHGLRWAVSAYRRGFLWRVEVLGRGGACRGTAGAGTDKRAASRLACRRAPLQEAGPVTAAGEALDQQPARG
jgi:uncharacterized protein (TIGR02996 family)